VRGTSREISGVLAGSKGAGLDGITGIERQSCCINGRGMMC
jgi:hypothetical protein